MAVVFANGNRYRREKAFERVLWAARSPTSARDRTAACRVRGLVRPETTIQGQSVTLTCVDGALASRRGRYIQVAPALPSGPVGVEVEGATVPCQGWGAVVLRSVDRRA